MAYVGLLAMTLMIGFRFVVGGDLDSYQLIFKRAA
jgi:hypothetical protein